MSSEIQKKFVANLNRDAVCDPLILLMEINHPDLSTPVFIANNFEDVQSNGNNYVASYFDFEMPSSKNGEDSRGRLVIDNIGRQLTQWIEQSCGGRCGTVIFRLVVKSCPDEINKEECLQIISVCMDCNVVKVTLGYEDLYKMKAVQKVFNECTAPGLI